MSIRIGNTTIYFGPLIAFLVVIIVVYFISGLSLNISGRKVKKSFETGAYNKVIKDGERLLKKYQKLAQRYKHKNTIAWIESLHFVLAVSYFSTMDWDLFLNHINSMSQYGDTKNFWLSLYYIYHDSLDKAQLYYDNIAKTAENATNISYLDCLICYKRGNVDSAKTKMNDIYSKLKHPILKHISDELFYKNQI